MATLRLFASIRVLAGTGRLTIDADTVGDVIDAAVERFGPEFAQHVEQCRVWLDGEPAERETSVDASSEVALLPPVSGGADEPGVESAAELPMVGRGTAVPVPPRTMCRPRIPGTTT